jgi:hypothetical protein
MCGRYSIVSKFEAERRLFGVNPNVPNWWRPRYNVAPTQEAPFRPNGQPRPRPNADQGVALPLQMSGCGNLAAGRPKPLCPAAVHD